MKNNSSGINGEFVQASVSKEQLVAFDADYTLNDNGTLIFDKIEILKV